MLPDSRVNARAHAFPVRVITVWNRLSADVVCSSSLPAFKSSLKNIDLTYRLLYLVKCDSFIMCMYWMYLVFFFFSWSRVSGIKLPYVGQLCHPPVVSYFLFTFLTVWFINK